ncbi:hypothetical protein ACSSV1_001884 [Labrenzia sp. MBR-25]|jgi:hypothetical protein
MAELQSELIALRIISSFALANVALTKEVPAAWLKQTRELAVNAVEKFKISDAADEEKVRDEAKQIVADMFDNIKLS